MGPQRIQRRRAKGWRKPENTVSVTRPGPFGNPFVVGVDGSAGKCVELFAALMAGYVALTCKATIQAQEDARRRILKNLHKLRGKNLMCYCAIGKPCHADVLLAIANRTGDPPQRN